MAIIDQDGVPGKVCRKCGEWKQVSFYSPKRVHGVPVGDGYQNICKRCRTAAELQRYHANPELRRAVNRARHQQKRDERLPKMRTYRTANREKILAQKRTHWAMNKELINAKRREEYASDPEPKRRAGDAYRLRNRDRINARIRTYRARYPDKIRAKNQNYYQTNYDKVLESVRRRELRMASAPGSHTIVEWEELKARFNYICLRCSRQEPEITLTRDHIIPITRGGSDNIDNIQPLCKPCNSAKNAQTIDYRPQWQAQANPLGSEDR